MSRYDWPPSTDVLQLGPFTVDHTAPFAVLGDHDEVTTADTFSSVILCPLAAGTTVLKVWAFTTSGWLGMIRPRLEFGVAGVNAYPIGGCALFPGAPVAEADFEDPGALGGAGTPDTQPFESAGPTPTCLVRMNVNGSLIAAITVESGAPTAGSVDVYALVALP